MNEDQITYVVTELKKGTDREALRATMRTHGYDDEMITKLLSEADVRMSQSPNQEHTLDAVSTEVTPTSHASKATLPSFGELIGGGFTFALQRLDILGLAVIFHALSTVPIVLVTGLGALGMFTNFAAGDPSTLLILFIPLVAVAILVGITLGILNNGAITYAVVSPNRTSYFAGFKWTWKNFWAFLWVSALVSLVAITGYVFLIVPGIIVLMYIALTLVVFVREDIRGMNALVRSTQLVYGNWWGIFLRLLVVGILSFAIIFVVSLLIETVIAEFGGESGFVVATITGVIVQFAAQTFVVLVILRVSGLLYESLVAQKPAFSLTGKPSPRTLYTVMAWFGLIVPILFGVLLSVVLASLNDARDKGADALVKSNINTLSIQAILYADDFGNYGGFCGSDAVQEKESGLMGYTTISCSDTFEAYAVDASLTDGTYYCVDSTGFSGKTQIPLFGATQCDS